MKFEITGKVTTVNKVEAVKNGYSQTVVVEQPETKDEYNRVTQYGQVFLIHIWSKENNAKFMSEADIGQIKVLKVWLRGERHEDLKAKKVYYFLKLNLL